MNQLYEGRDYRLYKIYVFGGIALLVIYAFATGIILEVYKPINLSDSAMIGIISAPITPWFLGILAYWWWVFLFKGNKEFEESLRVRPVSAPDISALKSWSRLHRSMSLYGGDVDEILKAQKSGRFPLLLWYGMANLLVLWILGNFWVWILFQESLPVDYVLRVWAPGVIVIALLMSVGTPFLLSITIKGGEAGYLAPLGLSIKDLPSLDLHLLKMIGTGKEVRHNTLSVMSGRRLGRRVQIEMAGKRSYTLVRAETPSFEIQSQVGKLVTEKGAPQVVIGALRGLRKAKRWKGVRVTGNSDGIAIERESTGQNMWLYDLWLIERLLEAIEE